MRVVTIVSLGASAVLGLAALVVAKTVLPNQAAAKVAGMAQPAQAGSPIVVATKPLKYGDKLDASALTIVHLPPDAVPQGAFTTVAAVLMEDHGGAPVVLTPISAKEPVLPDMLSGPGARPSVAAEVTPGMRAYTIRVNDVSGVGGHALPGDRVDVLLMRDLTPTGSTRHFVSEIVLQDVRVLAVDLNADLKSDKPATPSTATLEVSLDGGKRLAVAADLGKLSLALRRTGEATPGDPSAVGASTFGVAESHPASPRHFGGAPVRRSGGGGLIVIVEGARHGGNVHPPAPVSAPAPAPAPVALAATATSNG
jgi:pilus assembly protein CpaB